MTTQWTITFDAPDSAGPFDRVVELPNGDHALVVVTPMSSLPMVPEEVVEFFRSHTPGFEEGVHLHTVRHLIQKDPS